MDTDSIAREIVRLRNRLDELDRLDGAAQSDVDDERQKVEERLRDLRGLLSRQGADERHHRSVAEEVRYVPPS